MASIENSPKVKKKKESKEGKEKKKSEKDEWHVKTLEEIMEEKRRRKEQKGGGRLEEGELHPEKAKMRSPPRSQQEESDGSEKAEEEFDALQIQPPQATSKKESKSHRKDEKRKHSRHGNRDRERRHKRKRSHSKEKHRPEHKEQRRDPQGRQVSHDRTQSRSQQGRDPDRHWREQESREQSRKDRDRLERMERERERSERDRKKRKERSRGMERGIEHYEKVPSKDRRRGAEEQWRSRDKRSSDYSRHGMKQHRWVERERSPLKEKPQPLPLMEMKIDRPKPRSPSGKHDYGDSHSDDKERRRKERRDRDRDRKSRKEEQVEEVQPIQDQTVSEPAEHESSNSDDSSSEDSDDSGDSGDDSEAKSGSEASSDESDSDDDSDEDSDEEEEEEEEEGATEGAEKQEEGEHVSSDDDSGSEGSDSDSDSDSDSESDKDSESEKEEKEHREESEKRHAKKEKEAKPKTSNHDKKKRKSPEPSHRPSKSKYERKSSPSPRLPQKSKFERDSSPSGHEDNATQSSDGDYLPDSPPKSPVEFKEKLPPYLPAISGCRNVEEFVCLNKIEEGTYGVVYRAKEKRNDEVVALKRLKMEKEKEGFPITSLREISTLLKAQHPNIVTVREIVVGSNMDKIYIVMDYVEHDLKSLMETMKQPFTIGEVKCLMLQLLRGVHHLHDNWILHRDLKTSNLLLSHRGVLKIGDFGLAREYGSPLKMYTPIVVTLWYRAPELLLGAKEYACPIDMWSVGCIFAEFITMKPLFPGKSEVDQLNRIFKELGTPSEKIWPGYNELPAVKKMTFAEHPYNNLRSRFGAILSDIGFELMNKFLTYNPNKRITADEAVRHAYFQESPLPTEESMFPTWPAKSEMTRTTKTAKSPKPPEGGAQYANLGDEDEGFRLTLPTQGTSVKSLGFSLKF